MARTESHQDMSGKIRQYLEVDKNSLPADGGARFNRLIFAGSPYLLQHAENPVDWYEWGEEAFRKARAEDKPIFLSIGYATCHWCHVMAHESFEDPEVAEVLNRHFVSIKVDREERPDIDSCYMNVAQMLMGSGGWPLQVIMTPDRHPFYTVTYVPRRARGGMPGIIELLDKIARMWRDERQTLEQSARSVLGALERLESSTPGMLPGEEALTGAGRRLKEIYDGDYGGFGRAPKFPMPGYLSFLLRMWRHKDEKALHMLLHTLQMMRDGGIYDQLGFGFHRYSVDRRWLVPHFEKMLYDQALLAFVYLEAYQATGRDFCWTVADEIFTFVRRELTSPEGGFYAALDADTEGEEGKFYAWTVPEVRAVLDEPAAALFSRLYDITEHGNFEGKNILHLNLPPEAVAETEGKEIGFVLEEAERARQALLAARDRRTRPFRDEKIVTAWNGLMIAALGRGYGATGRKDYLAMAQGSVDYILRELVGPNRRLMRSRHGGKALVPGFLEDYAFFVWGLVELHQVTLDDRYLESALHFAGELIRLFGDEGEGGLFDTGHDAEEVLVRTKSVYDGVIPSGNAVAAANLLRLGRIAEDDGLVKEGERILRAFMGTVTQQPAAHVEMLAALELLLEPGTEISFSGPRSGAEFLSMQRVVGRSFNPALYVRYRKDLPAVDGKTTAHVCAAGACLSPVTTAVELEGLLAEK